MGSARAVVIKGDAATWPKGSIEYSDVDVLVANLSGARACLTAHLNRTRVIAVPPLQLHFDVLVPGGRNILVRFDLYGQLYFPRAALDPAWMEALRLRSVWALSPLGFAYRRQAFADACAVRLLEWRAFLGTTKAKRKEKHRHWIDEHADTEPLAVTGSDIWILGHAQRQQIGPQVIAAHQRDGLWAEQTGPLQRAAAGQRRA